MAALSAIIGSKPVKDHFRSKKRTKNTADIPLQAEPAPASKPRRRRGKTKTVLSDTLGGD